jgi:penicillin-binding protein 2
VDSVEDETEQDAALLEKFRTKQKVTSIPSSIFKVIKEGMHDVTVYGTAAFIKVPGHEYCAKTGTAQNPHGKNHSLFVCFAPKDNPKIAVAVIVENAGYGATWAGPIATLMMEKYLNDTLTPESKLKAETLSQVDLMPQAIKDWYVRNNKSAYLTPLEYNNDELSDVWDMEMLSADAVSKVVPKDTIKKDTSNKPSLPNTPAALPKTKKDSAILNNKKKPAIKKKTTNKNVNQL